MDRTVLRPEPAAVVPVTAGATRTADHLATAGGRPWWRRPALIVTVLTLAALGVRLWIPRGLWLDEATSWVEATQPFHRMLAILRTTDVHPPGYLAVLWADVRVFGQGELALRAPSIVAGVLLVPVLYLAGRDLWDRRAGLVAAAFGVVAPQMVWYSQEARMYAFFQLFAVLAVWMQVLAVRRGRWWHWAGWTLASAALVYTQYFTTLVIAVQQVVFLAVAVRRHRRREPVRGYLTRWFAATAALLVLLAPLVPFCYDQFVHNQNAGKGFGAPSAVGGGESSLSYYTVVANLIWAVWGYHSTATMTALGALWPLGLLGALLLLGRGRSRATTLLVAVGFAPMVLLYLVGYEKRFLFDLRYFSAIVPATVLLLARAASSWSARRVTSGLLVGVLVGTLSWGLVDEQLNHANPRVYDFRGALAFVTDQHRPGDVLYYVPDDLNNLADYYAPDVPSRALPARGAPRVPAHRHVFVMASFLDKPDAAAAVGTVVPQLRRHHHLVQVFRTANVTVWEFTA